MKRVIAFFLFVILTVSFAGCKNNSQRISDVEYLDLPSEAEVPAPSEIPENPKRIATSNSEYTIAFEVVDNKLNVSGKLRSEDYKYLLLSFDGAYSGQDFLLVENNSFNGTYDFPDKTQVKVDLFGGKDIVGNFSGLITDFVKFEKVNEEWLAVASPVLENNKEIFRAPKNPSENLSATHYIQSDDNEIIELANQITAGISDDYEKVRAVHDWVAENIYYDIDSFESGDYGEVDAKSVLRTKKSVCEGYANIMAALLRSLDIPTRKQAGYALGEALNKEWDAITISTTDTNHTWNEVFVNGRWIIIDATWDSPNEYRNGAYVKADYIRDTYFDVTLAFLSYSHKFI